MRTPLPRMNRSLLEWREFIIPLLLFFLFLAFTLPGISWGAPSGWHPDEIVGRSIKALHGKWKFSEINFDYPDLPQYAMFWLGKVVLSLGNTDREVLIASRILSAVLAGLTIILTYAIARRAGAGIYTAGLSGLFLVCVSEMTHNGRFAHNDTYTIFFTTLTVLLLVNYSKTDQRGWLYASFVAVGMAASSKFIGGSILIAPLTVYLMLQRKDLKQKLFSITETLFLSGVLTFLGFAAGTPKALLWMAFYFKRVFTALQWQISYGKQPDSIRGIVGQYGVMSEGLGVPLALLFGAAFLWAGYRVIRAYRGGGLNRDSTAGILAIILLGIFALDLPMMISYNYQLRYFLTLMPLLAILASFFVEDVWTIAKLGGNRLFLALLATGVAWVVLYSFARLISVTLLFLNDARIPASKFIATLPAGTSLEHTNYPPAIPKGHFAREHNYPVHFQKGANDTAPTDKPYRFNLGEAGLDERMTDYLVIDDFTSEKFKDSYICESIPVECEFFKQLETGRSAHYRLIAEFTYTLPSYLPQIHVLFANPEIRIYERIK